MPETPTFRKMRRGGIIPPSFWNAEHDTNVSNRVRSITGGKVARSKLGTRLSITQHPSPQCPIDLDVVPVINGSGEHTGAWELEARDGGDSITAASGDNDFTHWTPTLDGTATSDDDPYATLALTTLVATTQEVYLETVWDLTDPGDSPLRSLSAAPTIEVAAGAGGTMPASDHTTQNFLLGVIHWPSAGDDSQRPYFVRARCLPAVLSRPSLPRFSPLFGGAPGSRTLGITWGWLNGPEATDVDHEIPVYDLAPYMPRINVTLLDDAAPATLALTDGQTNKIYLQVTLIQRSAIMGETDLGLGTTGQTVWVDTATTGVVVDNNSTPPDAHTHGITDAGHDHEAQLDQVQLAYHIDPAVPPTFKVDITGTVPVNSELVRNIPWGEYVLNGSGVITSKAWYWLGDRDFVPNSWMQSNVSAGHGGANDKSVNPAVA